MKSSSFNCRLLITYLAFPTTVRCLFHPHPPVSCICPGLPFGIFQYQIRVILVLGSLVWYWKMQFGIEHEFDIENSYISYEDSTREEDSGLEALFD